MAFDRFPIRGLTEHASNVLDRRTWPATVFVGENGSGKSTIVEPIALAYGLSPEGGSTGAQHSTRSTESVLADHLQLIRNAGSTRCGYFLRAETMHSFFTYLESNPSISRSADLRSR